MVNIEESHDWLSSEQEVSLITMNSDDAHSESYMAKLETKLIVLMILTVMLNQTHWDHLGPLQTINKAHRNAVTALQKWE